MRKSNNAIIYEIKFPHLSLGYIGHSYQKMTVNSEFISLAFSEKLDSKTKLYFPQRIPNKDFFKEISRIENQRWSNSFYRNQKKIQDKILEQIKSDSKACPLKFNNLTHLALRFGMSDDLYKIFQNKSLSELQNNFESKFLIQMVSLIYSRDNKLYFDIKPLEDLFEDILNIDVMPISDRIIIVYGIVFSSRFKINFSRKLLERIHVCLKSYCDLISHDFYENLYFSVILRGLPMISSASSSEKQCMLNRSEKLARDLFSENQNFKILLAKDNLYTFLQTKAKWNIALGNYILVAECFEEMIDLDPFDSTAYAEYGLYLLRSGNAKLAEKKFSKAVKLGPPGLPMNLYYQANCSQLQNNTDKSISLLEKCISYDEEAISPFLDLLDIYSRINKKNKYLEIKNKILQTETLRSQLKNVEFLELVNGRKN